jgi:hypothetical protein
MILLTLIQNRPSNLVELMVTNIFSRLYPWSSNAPGKGTQAIADEIGDLLSDLRLQSDVITSNLIYSPIIRRELHHLPIHLLVLWTEKQAVMKHLLI